VPISRKPRRGHLAVVLAALCFGSTFPVTKEVLADAGPYVVVALRFLVGGLLALPFALRRNRSPGEWRAVVWCSIALFAGYVLVTLGLQRTSSTAAAFITYLLVVIVPVLSAVLLRRLPPPTVAVGVVLATTGLFLMAGGGWRLGVGELLLLGCAFAFAVHILVLDAVAARVDVVRLAAFQLVVVGLAALVPALIRGEFRGVSAGALWGCGWLAVAGLAGLLLQVVGQRSVGPTRTSLLLMLEPVIAAVGGYAIGERVPALGFVGAGLILAGIAVSEVPLDRPVKRAR
jgi:drug/metabolite transporter (DMT)-like permease